MKKLFFVILIVQSSCFTVTAHGLIQLIGDTPDDTAKVSMYINIAKEHYNNPDSALIYYNKAYDVAHNINAKQLMALSLKYIGTSYYYKSDFERTLNNWQKALRIYKEIDDKNGTATVLGNIGIIHEYQSNYLKAITCYKKALKINEEIDNKKGMAANYGNIGIMYEYQCDYPKALEYYQKALKINEELGNKSGMAANFGNIGIVYKQQNDYKKALEYYGKALIINEEIGKKNSIARNLINIGIVYTAKNDYEKALTYYQKALEINKDIGNRNTIASNLLNIGIIYEYQNNYSKALAYYKKALKINNKIGDKRSVAINLINIASIYKIEAKYNKAISYAKQALSIVTEIGDLYLEREIYSHLSEAYQGLNNYKRAIDYNNLWMERNDSIYNAEKYEAITEIQTKYETEKKDEKIILLQKDNEIKKLQLEKSKQRTKAQQRLFFAIVFVLFSIALIIWFIYRNYKNKQTINQQKLEYQKVLTEQKMLRSQMNPHFIFNSLNSIQAFISSEQSYEAEKYLARFAKLIRGILENSRADFITLDKEINVLELYLSLEQLRFEKRFTYNINIDNEIEQDFILIPPMLLQPFIENAILHGFNNRTNGLITINIKEKDEFIICEIDDNGIGRKASEENKQKKKYKSLATTITTDRLNALADELQKPAFFIIEDKIDLKTKQAQGTKVIIQIPYTEA